MLRTLLPLIALACLLPARVPWAADEPAKKTDEPAKQADQPEKPDEPSKQASEQRKKPDEPSKRVIQYRDDKLTLHVKDAPVTDILDELKKQSSAEVKG